MKDDLKGIIGVAIFLMILWGLTGLIGGDGFFGGIGKQIDAIGDIISYIIKAALFFGVIWLIITVFGKKDKKG